MFVCQSGLGEEIRKGGFKDGLEDGFETVVIDHKEDLHPQIVVEDENKQILAYYSLPTGAHIVVNESDKIVAGQLLAKTPRKVIKTKDITGGLPRVAELFEARKPKNAAEIARIDGIVEFGEAKKGKRKVIVRDPDTGVAEEHMISLGKHLTVHRGDRVKKGEQLTEGPVIPQEILSVCGSKELQEYLLNEIQEVYRLQGVQINYKHVELIIRQMLRKVRVTNPGDTMLVFNEDDDVAFVFEPLGCNELLIVNQSYHRDCWCWIDEFRWFEWH